MIKLLADQNLYKLDQFLPKEVDVTYYNPNEQTPSPKGFDAWLLRTVTRVNAQTLTDPPPSLQFIGTGSAGSDHLDIEYLENHQIKVVDAKGCNAQAVAEYVLTALIILQEKHGIDFRNMRIGVIGVGAVGTAVSDLLSRFGCDLVLYDPPRALRDPSFKSAEMVELQQCDILTLHVPFIEHGEWKTQNMIDENFLAGNRFEVFINAARGGVTDEKAVLNAFEKGRISYLITDVWENEPTFNVELAKNSFIATPHIAGYSEQAKLNASSMIAEKLCSFFDLDFAPNLRHEVKEILLAELTYSLLDLITRCHPMLEYDAALRDLIGRDDNAKLFAKLRTDRPYRYEYPNIRLKGVNLSEFPVLKLLGVNV
ncbi:MAG: 4-phosphoerythronate dehydrogenase [Balneolaceae bacterium]|nr:4-phosphoerythronate dehydrogenase [Balneolaceae bacterium]